MKRDFKIWIQSHDETGEKNHLSISEKMQAIDIKRLFDKIGFDFKNSIYSWKKPMRNKQLSLFPKNRQEHLLIKQAEGLTIIVELKCIQCKRTIIIDHHISIHSMSWMKKNWKQVLPNKFLIDKKTCSRECEEKQKRNKKPLPHKGQGLKNKH